MIVETDTLALNSTSDTPEDISVGLKQVIDGIFENSKNKYSEFDYMRRTLVDSKVLIEKILENYFSCVESDSCCADKARYVTTKLFKSIEKEQVLNLQYTYKEYKDLGGDVPDSILSRRADEKCFWCPCTFKNTEEAFNGILCLINPMRVGTFLTQQAELYKPYAQAQLERYKRECLDRLHAMKLFDANITIEEFIKAHKEKYPDVELSIQILNSKTGERDYFYDDMFIHWNDLNKHSLRDKKIIMINDTHAWENSPETNKITALGQYSYFSVTLEE